MWVLVTWLLVTLRLTSFFFLNMGCFCCISLALLLLLCFYFLLSIVHFQEPWSKSAAERALNNQGNYIAGCNIFALDLLKSATPRVPLNRRSVQMLADFVWPQGSLEKPTFGPCKGQSSRYP